jgi:hypothetical protein
MSDEIEIRKQGNQYVIGRIPSRIIRWGNVVILAICMLLLYMSFNLTFPVVVNGRVEITNDSIYLVVPRIKQNLIKEGQEINLRMDDYPYMDYGIVQGKISSLSGIRHIDNSAYIPVALSDERNAVKRQDLLSGMKGDGDIVVDKIPIIYRIVSFKRK